MPENISEKIDFNSISIVYVCYLFSLVLQPEEVEAYKWNYVPLQLAALEKLLTANDDGHGYFVGRQLSVADICIYDVCATRATFALLSVCGGRGKCIARAFKHYWSAVCGRMHASEPQ